MTLSAHTSSRSSSKPVLAACPGPRRCLATGPMGMAPSLPVTSQRSRDQVRKSCHCQMLGKPVMRVPCITGELLVAYPPRERNAIQAAITGAVEHR
jgi:hypothetical protein